jgi:hypothetical protein
MHSKGMVYSNINNERNYIEKTILRNTIFEHDKIISIFLKNKEIDKIGLLPSEQGFFWYNFFWVRASYIKYPPVISNDRFTYEYYIANAGANVKGYSLISNKIDVFSQEQAVSIIRNLPTKMNSVNFYFEKIFYGFYDIKIDVTDIVKSLEKNGIIFIPGDDSLRNQLFTDPCFGVKKFIYIESNVYPDYSDIYIKDGIIYRNDNFNLKNSS